MHFHYDNMKRWFSKICSDSQGNTNETYLDKIFWSNSEDSEDSEGSPVSKKKKTKCFTKKSKTWIKVGSPNTLKIKCNFKSESQLDYSISPCKDEGSPILNGLKLKESPVLFENNSSQEKSPVISRGNMRIRRRCKLQNNDNLIENIQDDSSSEECFLKQTLCIIDGNSPEQISQTSSEISIDPFPSQKSSEIVSSLNISNSSENKLPLYHQPPPRKRRFKKGGLARQLQKALDLQNTSFAIWKHELQLNKTKTVCEDLEFEFCIKNKWKEYGCTLLECKFSDQLKAKKVLSNFRHLKIENISTILIIISMNSNVGISLQENTSNYKIFPPYAVRLVKYQLQKTLCFFNASRFVDIKFLSF